MIKVGETDIELIFKLLKQGCALIIKTDTVWGLVSLNPQLLYDMKKRPLHKPLVRLVSSTATMHHMEDIHAKFIKKFWPGPITVIKDGISYRMPHNVTLLRIIKAVNNQRPLFCTSANISGGDPITTYEEACQIFCEWGDNCVYVVPKDDECYGESSTVVDIDKWKILRPGIGVRDVTLWIYKYIILPYKKGLEQDVPFTISENGEGDWTYDTRNLLLVDYEKQKQISLEWTNKKRKHSIFSNLIFDDTITKSIDNTLLDQLQNDSLKKKKKKKRKYYDGVNDEQ